VVVHTSDKADAGTDAPVSIVFSGSRHTSDELELKQPLRDDFEKGQRDEFFLDLGARDLGDIEAIDIGFYDRKKGMLERVKSSLGEDWWVEMVLLSFFLSNSHYDLAWIDKFLSLWKKLSTC
jgi:hypothetical protein